MTEAGPIFSLGSFSVAGAAPFAGMVRDGRVIALAALGGEGLGGSLLDVLEGWEANLPRLKRAAGRWADGDRDLSALAVDIALLRIDAPLRPRQIFATGANYRKHVIQIVMADPAMRFGDVEEAEDEASRRAIVERMMDERASNAEPYILSKLPTSIAGPFDALAIPRDAAKIDWECEIAVVIGRPARHVAAADAAACIAGYAIANDITDRDRVFRRDMKIMGTDWVSSKSQPGFTPFGPFLVPSQFVDPRNLDIRLLVNDRVMQDEHSSDMLISIERQIEYLSSWVQLLPGDVICTGSPAGNGSHHGVFLKPGDRIVASITGLGEQRIDCVSAS